MGRSHSFTLKSVILFTDQHRAAVHNNDTQQGHAAFNYKQKSWKSNEVIIICTPDQDLFLLLEITSELWDWSNACGSTNSSVRRGFV